LKLNNFSFFSILKFNPFLSISTLDFLISKFKKNPHNNSISEFEQPILYFSTDLFINLDNTFKRVKNGVNVMYRIDFVEGKEISTKVRFLMKVKFSSQITNSTGCRHKINTSPANCGLLIYFLHYIFEYSFIKKNRNFSGVKKSFLSRNSC